MNYKIVNAKLLVMGKNDLFEIIQKDLYIKDGKILAIGELPEGENGVFETVDATDRLVMPGLVNMHTHVYMTLFRGYADDVDFDEWLFRRIMPAEDKLSPEAAYSSSMLGCMEMIKSGTTCFMDMHLFRGQSCRAARDMGMRAYIGRGLVGEDLYTDGYTRFEDSVAEIEEYGSNLIKGVLSPHAIYTCSAKLYEQTLNEAQKRGLLIQTHLSESVNEIENCYKAHGMSPVELLDKIGFINEKATFAHCVQLNEKDIEILAERKANVVTNPASNAKLGNGFAPVCAMQKAGINVCLGTDSTASNNALNMFREMGLLSIIHKGLAKDSTAAPAQSVIRSATYNAGIALGLKDRLGVIAPGAEADIIFVNLNSESLFPNNDIIASLCYSANGSEVESVMIGGKFVMKNRTFPGIDTEKIYADVKKSVELYL
ncbi:MAG: amidohydrolase [Clostridia bacterium]|nr:amidohydrolase [Clostridia bacterium]